ncbi:MAG: sigma-E factor regulatory protein RseB domain-containing protein [Acidobacteriota bacterium]
MPRRNPLLLMLLAASALAQTDEGRIAPNGGGLEIDAGDAAARKAAEELGAPAGSLLARVRVPWEMVEGVAGTIDWTSVDPAIQHLAKNGYDVIVELDPRRNAYEPVGGFPSASHAAYQNAWLELCKAAARRYPEVRLFEIPLSWTVATGSPAPTSDVAFLLKKTAIAITGVRPKAKIVLGSVGGATIDVLAALMKEDVSAYVDVYSIADGPDRAATRAKLDALLADGDPGAEVWLSQVPPDGAGAGIAMRPYLRALRDGYYAATMAVPASDLADQPGNLGALVKLLPSTLTPVPGGHADVLGAGGKAVEGTDAVVFFDAKSLDTVVAWWGAGVVPAVALTLQTADVGKPVLVDPLGKKAPALSDFGKDNQARRAAAGVPLRAYPLLATFPREVSADIAIEPMKVAVASEEELPVAEIIARYQKFQAEQDDRFQSFIADERISLHYEISVGTTIDVVSDNVFYTKKGGETEWRETAFYVNGVKWRWGDRPKLPLIQPEKVVTVPLLITLGKEFDYELKGKEDVNGHPCYVVAFTPKDETRSAYGGRVWIDRKTFARIQMSVVQTALTPPVISNEETDSYEPVASGAGTFWMATRISGQQLFSIGGSSTPVVRQVEMSNFKINDPGFDDAVKQAYASPDIMFRETDKGYRYLDSENGQRVVNNKETRSSLLGAIGAFYTQDLDYPLPLAGINYFNFDLFHTGTQLNTFFAGPLLTLTVNKPDLWGKNQLSADVIGFGISTNDKVYAGATEIPEEEVKVLHEIADLRLGIPFAQYFRFNASYALDFYRYSDGKDMADDFVLPKDHLEHSASLGFDFKKSGWRATLDGTYVKRSSWEPWGRPGNTGYSPDHDSYQYGAFSAGKDFYFPKFMRLHADLTIQQGENQDRFSKFSFGYFGNRIRGFSGSGVRYDQGIQARGYYGFNVGEVVRLDANFDYARVRDRDAAGLDGESDWRAFYGVGLTGTLLGPWKTIINLDYGYGLHSDIPGLEHQSEYRIVILKVFK